MVNWKWFQGKTGQVIPRMTKNMLTQSLRDIDVLRTYFSEKFVKFDISNVSESLEIF